MNGLGELTEYFRPHDRPEFTSAWWQERCAEIEAAFADELPDDFMQHPAIGACGLETNDIEPATLIRAELDHVDTPTNLAHLYHLHRLGLPSDRVVKLIEWGGGFGNVARLTRRFDARPIHTIVDVPVMLALQAANLGAWCMSTGVTLAATGVASHLGNHDVFLGTFSVSECTPACHDFLIEKDWFGASKVLLAMEPDKNLFPEAYGLRERLLPLGFRETDCPWPGAIYLELDR